MPQLLSVLKSEISRLARKEVRQETERLQSTLSRQRKELTALRSEIAALQKALKRGGRSADARQAGDASPQEEGPRRRFSAARLAVQRQKLGLSAAAFGKLIGVTGRTVYSWETGSARPRVAQLEAIARVRTLNKSQIAEALSAG